MSFIILKTSILIALLTVSMTNKNATYLAINSTINFVGVMENISRPIYILFGPQTNSSPPVYMIDARIYNYSLTDREITKLFNGSLAPKLALQDQCLCPRDSPTVIPGQQNYGIKCTDHNNTPTYRLNNTANHPVQYAVDGDENTYWNSGTTESAIITLDLKNVFQLSSIEIHFMLDTSPSDMVLTLTYKGKSYTSTICGCNSSLPCRYLGYLPNGAPSNFEDAASPRTTILYPVHFRLMKLNGPSNVNFFVSHRNQSPESLLYRYEFESELDLQYELSHDITFNMMT